MIVNKNKALRLLHVVPSYVPAYCYGGTIYAVHGLCKALAQQGHDVHVYTTNANGETVLPITTTPVDIEGVKVHYFSRSHTLRRLFYAPSMRKKLASDVGQFDYVHLHSVFLWPTWQAARYAQKNHIPYVLSPHGMLSDDLINKKSRWVKLAWLKFIENKTIKYAQAVFATSNFEHKKLKKYVHHDKILKLANGLDLSEIVPANKPLLEGPYIAYLGRINWKKGLDRLLQAMAYLPDTKLVIAGNDEEGYWDKLQSIIIEHNLESQVHYIGALNNVDKCALLQFADCMILPSYNENFGLVVLEAMANRCPVIVTDTVGAASIVKKANAGIVLNDDVDVEKNLSKAIQTLQNNKDQRQLFAKNGQEWVNEHASWTKLAEKVTQYYLSIKNSDFIKRTTL